MESSMYFSMFVLAMCAVDLVWSACTRINTWWNKNVAPLHKPVIGTESRKGVIQRKKTTQRSDWYVFFHCSDLVGPEPEIKNDPPRKPNVTVLHQKKTRVRRSHAY